MPKNDARFGTNTDTADKYSVGPLPHETWLAVYHAIRSGIRFEEEHGADELAEEFEEVLGDFLLAHPGEGQRDIDEAWSEEMKDAYNQMVMEEIRGSEDA